MTQGTHGEVDATSPADRMRAAIPLGVALIVGVLTAIGIDGEVRERLIRNAPYSIFFALALAVLGVGLPVLTPPVLSTIAEEWKQKRWFALFGAVIALLSAMLLLAGAILVLYIGATGLAEREQPSLTMSATRSDDEGNTVVTVSAGAPSLSSSEKMLLRVASLQTNEDEEGAERACNTPNLAPAEGSSLLHWTETGPTRAGTAQNTVKVRVSVEEFPLVCAYVALFDRNPRTAEDDRRAWGLVKTTTAPTS